MKWYVPWSMYGRCLVCVRTSSHEGFEWKTYSGILNVMDGYHILMKSWRLKNLYILEYTTIFGESHVITSPNLVSTLCPNPFHMSEKGFAILHKHSLLHGMKQFKVKFCEHSVFGKQTRVVFDVELHSSQDIRDYIYFDVWVTSSTASHIENVYYVTFVDDYSRFVWIYFMQQKSEVFEIL